MLHRIWLLGAVLLPLGGETYHAACFALDAAAKSVYVSDVFETDCAGGLNACKDDVTSRWTAYLRKENLAQAAGATRRCEMYKDGSTPDESPRSRVRKWRDEEVAQAQARSKSYAKVVQTTFGME